jgi:hypothetical protein
MLHQRISVHGLQAKRLQDHHLQRAGEKIAVLGVLGHNRDDYIPEIAILEIGISDEGVGRISLAEADCGPFRDPRTLG